MADAQGIAADRLKQIVEKVERLEEEKREVAEQIKEVFAEAKSEGFDIRTLRQVLRLRRMKPHDRNEQEELLELYKAALGMA
jgi:uncharacterized protein (UPF0335 family)